MAGRGKDAVRPAWMNDPALSLPAPAPAPAPEDTKPGQFDDRGDGHRDHGNNGGRRDRERGGDRDREREPRASSGDRRRSRSR